MLPNPVPAFTMTAADITAMIAAIGETPPDTLTRYRDKLYRLLDVARQVYPRENLMRPSDTLCIAEVVETVFYYFDAGNRRAVARGLGMEYEDMMLLLAGFILAME